ncbi:Zn-dependent exopeptidase [Delitschia confertaspora ATCC 74209]|uniref:Peptide hydrolase n=1 Tax=Delitschia confertaspora ATCC 74209 TaxID=1513339 RepID=A0A9P4JGV2_9PLEO|nr:Zn-dependent exopeptidase [Delitschia confertaspora ATCC 74209]
MRPSQILLPALSCLTSTTATPTQSSLQSYSPLLPPTTSKELLSLHHSLIEIESISGNEGKIGKWLSHYLSSQNFTVELQEVASNRYNVFAYGSKRLTNILVSSHIDTVPPFWPYEYNSTDDTIHGRGSVDAKASVAAQIIAVRELREKLLDELSLLFVVGEEVGGDGMAYFSDHQPRKESGEVHKYDTVIFGEPTEGKLVCGHKGMLSFTLKVRGKAAHSGYPWLGVSANDVLIEALAKLLALREKLPSSEKYGNTTMNFGRIDGGVAANVVAETAEAKIAIRLAASTPKAVRVTLLEALSDIQSRAEEQGGKLDIVWGTEGYPPVDIDCDVEGFETMTVNYGTDIPNLKGDHRRYLYGPGNIFVAHSDHEALTRKELEQAVLDYRKLIIATNMMRHQDQEVEEL